MSSLAGFAQNGSQAIEFNANNQSSTPGNNVSQSFDTEIGANYIVTFYVGRLGNPGNVSLRATVKSQSGNTLNEVNTAAPTTGYSTAGIVADLTSN